MYICSGSSTPISFSVTLKCKTLTYYENYVHIDRPLGVHSPKIQFSVMQPRVVILVPYWKMAQEIYDECCNLVGNRHGNKESVLVIYGGGYEETQEVRCVAEILIFFVSFYPSHTVL